MPCTGLVGGHNVELVFETMRKELNSELRIGVSILEPILAWLGLAGSALLGAIWTGQAVLAGNQMAVLGRFAVSVAFGFYYLALVKRSQRR